MNAVGALALGREAYERQAWEVAHAQLSAGDAERALEADDLMMLATASQMVGAEADAASAWARAHTAYLERDDKLRAARSAYGVVMSMLFRGEMAQANGWIARATRMLESVGAETAEHGYLLCAVAMRSIRAGEFAAGHSAFVEACAIGERANDQDLTAQARHGEGRSLIRLGEVARGVALLDEVMAALTAGTVSPLFVGPIYCSVLEACQEIYDLRRAHEWTEAMAAWCARQPDALAFRGQCLVHRAELMTLHGAWTSATSEAEQARERLMRPPPHRAIGLAHYRIAELHRLRGEHSHAEDAYKAASQSGLDPQPGLSLLRLAQGRVGEARAAIARAVDEAREPRRRVRLLPALIEASIAASEIAEARVAAEELCAHAATSGAAQLRAEGAFAMGSVMLAEENWRGALGALREAFATWQELGAPYDAARARALLARAFRALGDTDSAAMELDCAREIFAELGAAHELARIDAEARGAGSEAASALTARELEVLRLVATGKTNRAIAARLGISDKTVARHVSNIFTKLGLSSRAAATAYAYERRLLESTT